MLRMPYPAWFLKLTLLGFSSQDVFDDLLNHASRLSIPKLGSFLHGLFSFCFIFVVRCYLLAP